MPETRGQSSKRSMKRNIEDHAEEDTSSENSVTIQGNQAGDLASSDQSTTKFTITNLTGDLTTDPPNQAVLIHSVNCMGEWGSGVALALREAFPCAFESYEKHCESQAEGGRRNSLLGTGLLIPPTGVNEDRRADPRQRWIACLFVSEGYGRKTKSKPGKAKPADITRDTKLALVELRRQLEDPPTLDDHGREVQAKPDLKELWACKFNSGSFGVPWERTVEVIEDVFHGWEGEMKVVSHG